MGFSRDDAGKFIGFYLGLGILDEDPFASIEQSGIGKLMEMTVEGGHAGNPYIEMVSVVSKVVNQDQ